MIDKIQDMYIKLFEPLIPLSRRINDNARYAGITVCFIINIIMFCIVQMVLGKDNYFYNTLGGMFLLMILLFLSLDKSLNRVKWRPVVCFVWFLMCVLMTVSDVIVPKQSCGLGIILGFLFTGLFFVWQNHTRRDLLWKSFKDSIRITFDLMVIFSFLFRPYFEGGRYAGIFTNPNTFGLYLLIILCVYLSDLDWFVETARPVKKQLNSVIHLALVLFYVSVSQARTSMIAVVAVFAIWVLVRIILDVKRHKYKPFIISTLLAVGLTVGLYPVFFFALNHVPNWVGHPIIYHDDAIYLQSGDKIKDVGDLILQEEEKQHQEEAKKAIAGAEADAGNTTEAASGSSIVPKTSGNRMSHSNVFVRTFDGMVTFFTGGEAGSGMDKLNALSSGRFTIYSAYKDKLNFAGHKNISKTINGHTVAHAHNNWLQFGYTYGIIGMIVYTIFTIMAFSLGIRFYMIGHRRFASYCFLPLAIIVGFLAATMTECLFQPFEVFPAFAFFLCFGDLFLQSPVEGGKQLDDKE